MVRSALRAYRMGEPASLAIELRETGRVVGTIGFVWIDDEHNCAEIGYSLAQEYWGRGLMTEALRAMLEFAFVRSAPQPRGGDVRRAQPRLGPGDGEVRHAPGGAAAAEALQQGRNTSTSRSGPSWQGDRR